MKTLTILICLLMSTDALSQWRILAPNDIHIDAYKNETVHDPYLNPVDAELGYGAGFNLDLNIVKYNGLGLYWDNLLHFDQSSRSGQVRHGGWQYEIGVTVYQRYGLDKIQLFKQHHSRHIFEETREEHFPVYDRFGIRMRIYP